jgi:hypothetical protein
VRIGKSLQKVHQPAFRITKVAAPAEVGPEPDENGPNDDPPGAIRLACYLCGLKTILTLDLGRGPRAPRPAGTKRLRNRLNYGTDRNLKYKVVEQIVEDLGTHLPLFERSYKRHARLYLRGVQRLEPSVEM